MTKFVSNHGNSTNGFDDKGTRTRISDTVEFTLRCNSSCKYPGTYSNYFLKWFLDEHTNMNVLLE